MVSHMDAVSASVSRFMPWAVVYPVRHTGYTVSYREKYEGVALSAVAAEMFRVQGCRGFGFSLISPLAPERVASLAHGFRA